MADWGWGELLDTIRAHVVGATVGATVGVLLVWTQRPDPPRCATLRDGTLACMPIHVVPPPRWVYAALGAAGAVSGALLTMAIVALWGRPTS